MRKLLLVVGILALALPCVAQSSHNVNLSWTASTDAGSGYNIYRLTGTCPASTTTGSGTKLTATPLASGTTTFVDSNVTVGTFCYYATAVLSGAESGPSNLAPAVILPASPTTLKVTSSQ